MIDLILNFEWEGILLYWLPLAVCAVGYTARTWRNVQKDLKEREMYNKLEALRKDPRCPANCLYTCAYAPTCTIGTLIGYGFASIIPMVNWICVIGDIAPDYLSGFFKTIGGILNQPLVPKK